MSLCIGSGYFPACISNDKIIEILKSDIPPEMSLWEKIKDFFFLTHQAEVQECIYQLCHPPEETTAADVETLFKRLQGLAHPGYADNFKSKPEGLPHFCIYDKNNNEILSIMMVDDYTVTTGESDRSSVGAAARSYPLDGSPLYGKINRRQESTSIILNLL